MKKKNGASVKTLYRAFVYLVLLALAVSIFVPVAWVFLASIKENCRKVSISRTLSMHLKKQIWASFS